MKAGVSFYRTMDHDIAHSVYGMGPGDVVYELYADVVKDWRTQRTGIVTKAKPEWAPGMTPPACQPCYHDNPPIDRVANAVFHPLRTTHATIVVPDLSNAIDYYTSVVGLSLASGSPTESFAALSGSCSERSLVLVAAGGPVHPVGYHHVGLRVSSRSELATSVSEARAKGLKVIADVDHAGRR